MNELAKQDLAKNDLYSAEDAQRILQIAIARDTESGELSRTQLLEIAAELGIAAETLRSAEQEWLALKDQSQEQKLFHDHRLQRFQHHLVRYGIINGFFVAIDLLLGGGLGFSLYIALIWGMFVALHGWRTYQTSGYRYQQDFEKWRRNRLVKQTFGKWVNRLLDA
jgi:2TM domain